MFFSTQYCAGVENFQCVPRDETPNGSCENLQRKLRTLGKDLEKYKQGCQEKYSVTDASTSNNTIKTVLIVMCVIVFLVAVILLFLFVRVWIQLRRIRQANADKDVGHELKTPSKIQSVIHQNTTAI